MTGKTGTWETTSCESRAGIFLSSIPAQYTSTSTAACSADITTPSRSSRSDEALTSLRTSHFTLRTSTEPPHVGCYERSIDKHQHRCLFRVLHHVLELPLLRVRLFALGRHLGQGFAMAWFTFSGKTPMECTEMSLAGLKKIW